jgi:hypothetical protein
MPELWSADGPDRERLRMPDDTALFVRRSGSLWRPREARRSAAREGDRVIALLAALALLAPTAHVEAAQRAARSNRVDAGVLLAIAHHETAGTFRAHSVNLTRGKLSCGVMQVRVGDVNDPIALLKCAALMSPAIAYQVGAMKLAAWMVEAHGDLAAALRGYGCGHERGTSRPADSCRGFDAYVMGRS